MPTTPATRRTGLLTKLESMLARPRRQPGSTLVLPKLRPRERRLAPKARPAKLPSMPHIQPVTPLRQPRGRARVQLSMPRIQHMRRPRVPGRRPGTPHSMLLTLPTRQSTRGNRQQTMPGRLHPQGWTQQLRLAKREHSTEGML